MMAGAVERSLPAGDDLAHGLAAVRERMVAAGGDPAQVTIVAVTKGFALAAVQAALAAGLRDVGENYARELETKARELGTKARELGTEARELGTEARELGTEARELEALVATPGPRWHFLGSPQRNKVARLAPLVSLWQGVDRVEVMQAIATRRPGAAVLVEVNVGGEAAKHGCTPADAPDLVGRGVDLGLDVRGLMTVAPAGRVAAQRCFAALAALAGRLGLRELSMGMSDDFDLAVAEGATMVRLGRALFGPRPNQTSVRR